MTQFRKPAREDVSLSLATRSHAGTSHSPERRGEGEVADYVSTVQSFNDGLVAIADTDDRMVEAVSQAERFREGYVKRLTGLWSTRSRIMSTMITGPANFPVRRQEKAWRAYDTKSRELSDWMDRARKAAVKAVLAVGAAPVKKSAGAKIGTETRTVGSVEIITNHDIERVQIIFGGKPSPEIIAELKGAAWNWSPRNSAWQRKITSNAIYSADRIAKMADTVGA